MSKPHYRLVKLRDCPDGARVFYITRIFRKVYPITVITQSVRKGVSWLHYGHQFDIKASRTTWGHNTRVWIAV